MRFNMPNYAKLIHPYLASTLMYLTLMLLPPIGFMMGHVALRDFKAGGYKTPFHWGFLTAAVLIAAAIRVQDPKGRIYCPMSGVVITLVTLSFGFLDYPKYQPTGHSLFPYLAVLMGLANADSVVLVMALVCLQRRVYLFSPSGIAIIAAVFAAVQGAVLTFVLVPPYYSQADGHTRDAYLVTYAYSAGMSAATLLVVLYPWARISKVGSGGKTWLSGYFLFEAVASLHLVMCNVVYLHVSIVCADRSSTEENQISQCVI